MGIIDTLKSAAKALQEAGKIDLYNQISEVQTQLLSMRERIANLENENKDLKSNLEIKGNLRAGGNWYWLESNGKKEGPYCTGCWDTERKLVRLHKNESNDALSCPKCKVYAKHGQAVQFRPSPRNNRYL